MFLGKINVIWIQLLLPLVSLRNVLVQLQALRVGEGALVLDSLADEDLFHRNLDLFGRNNCSSG